MRILFWKLKTFFRTATAALFVLLLGTVLFLANSGRFSALDGQRTYYLYSASSQGVRTHTLRLSELFFVQGECVRFTAENGDAEQIAAKLLEAYGAELLFTETVCGVTSYYANVPKWADGVCIGGETVNLHVAICGRRVAVGSPIIFDGF